MTGPIRIERWPSELPLYTFAVLVSIPLWIVLAISIVGLAYALMLGAFFFIMHVAFIAHVRGSGVRLGPDQFPELYTRVQEIARRFGMEQVPDAYVMQAGGALNAFAARFMGANLIVLYSDLLDACGEDESARDMIIGHELGHIHAGHLRFRFLTLPAALIPFLGGALSRAREFTCDRYGLASAGNREGALLGLSILAAGAVRGPKVNRQALVRQREDLNTGWMTLGSWLSTHPPLARRLYELQPALAGGRTISITGRVRALLILFGLIVPILAALGFGFAFIVKQASSIAEQASAYSAPPPAEAKQQLEKSVAKMRQFLEAEIMAGRELPVDYEALLERWAAAKPSTPLPRDPYDGDSLGYYRTETGYILWSVGPDQEIDTPDDIEFASVTSR